MGKKIVQCHRSERVVARNGVQHKAIEVIFGGDDSLAVTRCHKRIVIPHMGKSPEVKSTCKTCYE